MCALEYGHTQTALEFLPYLEPDNLSQALTWAAEAGKTEIIMAVLEIGRVEVNKMTSGKTLAYLAAYKHDLHSLQKLLSLEANIKIRYKSVFGKRGIR